MPPNLQVLDITNLRYYDDADNIPVLPASLKTLKLFGFRNVHTIETFPPCLEELEISCFPSLLWIPDIPHGIHTLKFRNLPFLRNFPNVESISRDNKNYLSADLSETEGCSVCIIL